MESPYTITTFPSDGKPAVHAYFDLCPEDPTGERVVYFRFDGPMPCGGQIMVANRDGSDARLIGRRTPVASAHSGARQQWADAYRAAYNIHLGDKRVCELADVRDGSVERLENSIRMFCPETGAALTSTHETGIGSTAEKRTPHEVLLKRQGETTYRSLFSISDCLALHPRRDEIHDTHLLMFKHTKWAPGGERFFVVFHNERAHGQGLTQDPFVKCLMLCNVNGSDLTYLTEFGHHPMWGSDDTYVYYHERQDGRQHLIRCDIEGNRSMMLEDAAGSHSSISPDGTLVVTDVYSPGEVGHTEIHLVETATGARRSVASFDMADPSRSAGCHVHPVWSRDGQRIYFAHNEVGKTHFCALDLA